ncbi:MAG: AAA family ATPase, partial [Solirubrobacteraceae bacterium]
ERCGTENPSTSRFCSACGAELAAAPAIVRQTRKVVTALFCDVTGSTALGEELDPEVLRTVMNRYFAVIRKTIEHHGGTVEKFIGDAVMAVFGIPTVREDDALRAVRAAAEIRERLPAVAEDVGVMLRFRTGVNTGQVLMSEGENLATGDAVNVAARLEQAAAPGEIVIGAETLRLVRDAVEVQPLQALALKGKSEPVEAFRLLRLDPSAPGLARHLDAPLVGREQELHVLREAWDRVVDRSGCHLFTLLGTAGVGKSRLVAELLTDVAERATVLRGRCLAYGEGITFWPLVEALTIAGEPAAPVLTRLNGGGAAVVEELFWEVRRLLEALASERPVVLYLDDLQWAEPMLLDLLDHVADLSRGAPILVLCTARPELLDDRPNWGGGKLNATTVLLEPLAADESLVLLEQLGNGLDREAQAHVIAASEGNPLFLEEMVALARESGTLMVPPTIQALLGARLERLGLEERQLLERGAVEGEVFHRLAVRALAGEPLATQVDSRLAGLVRRELIRPHPPTFQGDEAFRFRHLLIRDAAYDSLPKAERAELHQAFADWLERVGGELPELDEIAGWHLEQAVRYRHELGQQIDPRLSGRAAERLYTAGRRAAERDDGPAARNLLQRARALASAGGTLHAAICVELAELLLDAGEFELIEELLSAAEHEPELGGLTALTHFGLLLRTRPHGATRALAARLPAIIEQFEHAGDERGLAKAHLAWCELCWLGSHAKPAAEQAALSAEHAKRAGDLGQWAKAVGWCVVPLCFSEDNVEVLTRAVDAMEAESAGPYAVASLHLGRGWIADLDGRNEDGIAFARRACDGFEALGMPILAGGCYQQVAQSQLLFGDRIAARETLLQGAEIAAGHGEQSYRSTTLAMLAEVEQELGNRDAALAAIELTEQLGAPEDTVNFTYTHGVRALLALEEGDLDEAERWARSALERAYETDFYWCRAKAR